MRSSTNPLTGFLETLELRRIRQSRSNLRSETGPSEGLITSIEERGLLEPVVARLEGLRTCA